jgi:hypothetical protein
MENHALSSMLRIIFSDAQVVDVDFSQWDYGLSIWMLADHLLESGDRHIPLVVVTFEAVTQFSVSLQHYADRPPPPKHFQWRVHNCEFGTIVDGVPVDFQFWGTRGMPTVTIRCGRVSVRRESHRVLDAVFPKWSQPWSSLARPGLNALYEQQLGRRLPGEAGNAGR